MGGSNFRLMSALGLVAAGLGEPSVITDLQPAAPGLDRTLGVTRYPRSKGQQAKPKKRPNRLTISKRVRRKHRRARR